MTSNNNQMTFLVTDISFDNIPSTIKIPASVDNELDKIEMVRSWLFNYRQSDNNKIRIANSPQEITLNYESQPNSADLADDLAELNKTDSTDNNYVEYQLSCFYPNSMIINVDYNCIKYWEPSKTYATADDVIDQEIFESLMEYLPVSIYLTPIK